MKSPHELVSGYSTVLEQLRRRVAALERAAAGSLYARNRVEGALLERRAAAAAERLATAASRAGTRPGAPEVREIEALEAELRAASEQAERAVEAFRAARRGVAEVEREKLRAVLLTASEGARSSRRDLEVDARLDALRAELEASSIERELG